MSTKHSETIRPAGERTDRAGSVGDAIDALLEQERARSKPDQPAVEAAIMGLLLSDEHRGPWTRPEIELEMGGDILTVCDALVALHRSGLIHLEGALVIASRAAQRFDDLPL